MQCHTQLTKAAITGYLMRMITPQNWMQKGCSQAVKDQSDDKYNGNIQCTAER
jgi:hypothetical protein